MQLFFFPRYEYSREQLYRQDLGAEGTQGGSKCGGCVQGPSPTCLEQSAQGLPGLGGSSVSGVPMVGGKSGVPMVGGNSQGVPMLPGFPLLGGPMLGGSSTSTGVPMIGGSCLCLVATPRLLLHWQLTLVWLEKVWLPLLLQNLNPPNTRVGSNWV